MPRGAKVKTSWQRRAPIPTPSHRRIGEAWRTTGKQKPPGSSYKVVMGKPRDYSHPMEEIFNHPGHVHDRLVELQEECEHSYTKIIATQRNENGNLQKLVECTKCWTMKWLW